MVTVKLLAIIQILLSHKRFGAQNVYTCKCMLARTGGCDLGGAWVYV